MLPPEDGVDLNINPGPPEVEREQLRVTSASFLSVFSPSMVLELLNSFISLMALLSQSATKRRPSERATIPQGNSKEARLEGPSL